MNCQQVDDLLAAYALDAVDDDERAAIEAHLATCDRHEEVTELRAASAALATLAEEREPSADLEARILADARGVADAPSVEGSPERVVERAEEPVRLPERTSHEGTVRERDVLGRPGRGRSLVLPAAIAAAVLLVAVGFGAGAFLAGGDGDDDGGSQIVQTVSTGERWMRAEATEGDATVKVTLAGLRRLPESEGYQVWAIRDGGWLSLGVCNTDEDGWWAGDFDFALEPEDALAVTVEPAGGSERPTGEALLRSVVGE